MADKVKGILLREEVFEALQALSDEQRGKLILALIAEAGGCDAPELDPITRMAYLCILPGVKRAQDESFRRHSANIENGKKGGRPRKQPVDNECAPQKPTGFEENLNQSNPIQTNPNQEVNTPLTPHGGAGRTRKRVSGPDSLPALTEAIEAYTEDDGLRDALGAYVAMRQKIRKPLTGQGLRLSLRELDRLAGDDVAQKIAIVEQSVQRSWQGLFALKPDSGSVQQDSGGDLLARMEASRREAKEAALRRAQENSPWGRVAQ
jgi:hypothetical protein